MQVPTLAWLLTYQNRMAGADISDHRQSNRAPAGLSTSIHPLLGPR
jgi:hypothetical protein